MKHLFSYHGIIILLMLAAIPFVVFALTRTADNNLLENISLQQKPTPVPLEFVQRKKETQKLEEIKRMLELTPAPFFKQECKGRGCKLKQ